MKKLKGIFPKDDLPYFGKAVLKRAIKLQIGCGTEPTLYKDLDAIIKLGKDYKVPYISMTTNANNIELNKLRNWCRLGLDEITVSLHGVNKTTYEDMMGRGNFDRFLESLEHITTVKNEFPSFQLRETTPSTKIISTNWLSSGQFLIPSKLILSKFDPLKIWANTAYQNFSMKGIIPNTNTSINNYVWSVKNEIPPLLPPNYTSYNKSFPLIVLFKTLPTATFRPLPFGKRAVTGNTKVSINSQNVPSGENLFVQNLWLKSRIGKTEKRKFEL